MNRGPWQEVDGVWTAELNRAHQFVRMFIPDGVQEMPRARRPIFRGQGDAKWKLTPPVFRPGKWLKRSTTWIKTPTATYHDLVTAEHSTVREFFDLSDREGLRLPEDGQRLRSFFTDFDRMILGATETREWFARWPHGEILSILALAQHSGITTRLLDWSWSPFVASYFAARDAMTHSHIDPDDRFAIWQLDQDSLKQQRQAILARDAPPPIELVTAPGSEINNLRAQQGVFTLLRSTPLGNDDSYSAPSLENVLHSRYRKAPDSSPPLLLKITLPNATAPDLLASLSELGVHTASLFPGYAGVAQAMQDEQKLSPIFEQLRKQRRKLMSSLEQDITSKS